MTPRILPMGDRALLAEYDTLEDALGAYRGLDASAPVWVTDLVPAARTVLVRFDSRATTLRTAAAWIETAEPVATGAPASGEVAIDVRYDGPDLSDAADALGLSVPALVARHTATVWTSAFIGFAPGFAYLVPDEPLPAEVPRRSTSRPRIEAGSVGLAGAFSGIYPRSSPGGWQLIGSADAALWDPDREPPALLAPGTRVRFTEAGR